MITAHIITGPSLSRAMFRVERALQSTAPAFVCFTRREDASLWVIPAVGYDDTAALVKAALAANRSYVIIQYCLRSTQRPKCSDWLELWQRARLVWSYYDLPSYCRSENVTSDFKFYGAPLGVDATIFTDVPVVTRVFGIMSSGYVSESECVRESVIATGALGRRHFHLGPDLGFPAHVTHSLNIPDDLLAHAYRSSEYVIGLRRCEGFELPAAEGLLCGARPIVFDQPHYRRWYGEWAETIPEEDPQRVTRSLARILSGARRPVTAVERTAAATLFNWSTIGEGFWSSIFVER